MKKVLLGLGVAGLMLSSFNSDAQTFTTEAGTADTVRVAVTKTDFNVYNRITNTTSANIRIDWKVVNHDFPTSWTDISRFGICDNASCRTNDNNQLTNGSTFTSFDYAPSVEGDWHFQLVDFLSAAPGTHFMTINFKENGGTYDVTKTFVFTVFANSIENKIGNTSSIVLYPNPATDKLSLTFGTDTKAHEVSIYNYVGKVIATYPVRGEKMTLNIKDIPSGMYYLRVADNNGHVFETKRFTRR